MLFQKPTYDWLIAGLGNPGPEYEKTRHNTGFMSLDLLASRLQVKVSKERFKALTAQADYDGQRLLLMKPQTFMNASGIAIEAAAHFYKIPPERVLVLFDDISLPGAKPHPDYDLADWVLSTVSKTEWPDYQEAMSHAGDAALCIVKNGCEKAAAEYNGKMF